LPREPRRWSVSLPPSSLALPQEPQLLRDYHLPLVLLPQEKEVLDRIGQWPFCTRQDLESFLGISPSVLKQALERPYRLGLMERFRFPTEQRRRLALSDRGLLLLARRDRLPLPQLLHA